MTVTRGLMDVETAKNIYLQKEYILLVTLVKYKNSLYYHVGTVTFY